MYFLAPLVLAAGFSVVLYGQKLIMTEAQYKIAEQTVKEVAKFYKAIKAQKKAQRGVVQQFQAQSAYGSDIGRLAAAQQYVIQKSY